MFSLMKYMRNLPMIIYKKLKVYNNGPICYKTDQHDLVTKDF